MYLYLRRSAFYLLDTAAGWTRRTRTCRVVMRRDATSQVEFGLYETVAWTVHELCMCMDTFSDHLI